jgi:sulfatase-like protein
VGVPSQIPQRSNRPILNFSTGWRHAELARCALYVIFYTLLANIPFWVASPLLGISRNGWFCLEYVAVGLIALFAPPILAAVLLLSAIVVDVIAGVSETYLLPVSQLFANVGAVRQFSASRLFALATVLLLTLMVAAIAASLSRKTILKKHRTGIAVCLIAFAMISLSIDGFLLFRRTGDLPIHFRSKRSLQNAIDASYFPELLVSRIPAFRLVHRKIYPAPTGFPIRSATAIALESAANIEAKSKGELPNLVVILVESWGLAAETSISNALIQPYAQPGLLQRYDVQQGTVLFYGSTVAGEGRELCRNTMGFQLMVAPPAELHRCLPDRLTALGYHDVAIHGMNGEMFDRVRWYKTMGFQETWFNSQFKQENLPDCPGPFWGTCDAAIAEWIGRRLEKRSPNPEFLYWVTLNSHLPVIVPSPLKGGASCSITQSLSEQPSLCSWYQLIANVHHSVADMAMSNLGRATVFVIVGDHAPPYSDPSLRDRFSQSVVPYVVLVPRNRK